MAKTANCVFCGKELTTGLFSGTTHSLNLDTHSFHCCDDCRMLHDNKAINNRFATKLKNMKYKTRIKPTDQEVLQMYLAYEKEMTNHILELPGQATMQTGFYCYAGKYFSVREYAMNDLNISNSNFMKATLKSTAYTESGLFTADDITCIEYRKDGLGQSVSLFKRAYTYYIRLNDHKTTTYRPCITRTVVTGRIPFFHRSADKAIRKELTAFRDRIGSTLPIVKVKKFK